MEIRSIYYLYNLFIYVKHFVIANHCLIALYNMLWKSLQGSLSLIQFISAAGGKRD